MAAALRLRRRRQAPARVWLQFLGYLASLVVVLPDCRLHMRPLQLHLLRHYRPNRDPLTRLVPLSPTIRLQFLRWSRRKCLNSGNPLRVPQPTVTVTTDASRLGWGGHCLGNAAFGDWPRTGPLPHINVLEFQAVLLSLHSFLPLVHHHSVLIRTDNITVAAYINRQGGTHSTRLNALAAQLWTWCRREGIIPSASYIPGQENLIADFLSRGRVLPSEWTLHPQVMDRITRVVGPLGVVLFASSLNARLQRYCSRVLVPAAWRIDAFSFRWEGFRGYAFPPIALIPRVSGMGATNSTLVAEEELVPRPDRPPSRIPEDPADSPGPDRSADLGGDTPETGRAPPDCMAIVREANIQAGLSERAAALIAGSRRESTCDTYNSRLAGYFQWCDSHGVDPRSAPVTQVVDFLITLFDKGREVSTICGYRSAIAAIHTGFSDGTCVSSAPCLGKLLRALYLKRSPVRKLLPSWSLPSVLEALVKPPFEPLAEASLRDVTVKTVFLLAIASGQRRNALHALSTAPVHMRWERSGVRLIPNPSYIAKMQTAASGPVEMFIQPLSVHSSITEDKLWCPVRALKFYWHRTKAKRSGDQLFIITKEPYSPASRDTISKWIVAAIRAAGSEALTPVVSPHAHDTRSISTSWALFSGVSVEEIHKAAYWRSPNSFISFYLRDVPAAEPSFSRAALAAAARQSR